MFVQVTDTAHNHLAVAVWRPVAMVVMAGTVCIAPTGVYELIGVTKTI